MWDHIFGNNEIKDFLASYLARQEKPHALLFNGAAGLGKRTLAFAFARTLLCQHGQGGDGCESCRLLNFENGNVSHPDFLYLDKETGAALLSIAQIRDLLAKSAFAPVLSSAKLCIINHADSMSEEAANSFLKLLEDPPAAWIFILLAEKADTLLPTILSRVVRLNFRPIPEAEMLQALAQQKIAPEQCLTLARLSEGSYGRALQLAAADVFTWRKQALAFLNALPLAQPLNYLAAQGWYDNSFDSSKALLIAQMSELLLRDLLSLKLALSLPLYNDDLASALERSCQTWRLSALRAARLTASQTCFNLLNGANYKQMLESMALKIDLAYKE